jgi:hypothetical protein
MANSASQVTQTQLDGFVTKLRGFRESLDDGDKALLDAMYYAAAGKHEEKDEDTQAYWVAAGPRGVAAGPGFTAAPWGVAYGVYHPVVIY